MLLLAAAPAAAAAAAALACSAALQLECFSFARLSSPRPRLLAAARLLPRVLAPQSAAVANNKYMACSNVGGATQKMCRGSISLLLLSRVGEFGNEPHLTKFSLHKSFKKIGSEEPNQPMRRV